MERRRFTLEFKLDAVRLIRHYGMSYAQAFADLKVHPTQRGKGVCGRSALCVPWPGTSPAVCIGSSYKCNFWLSKPVRDGVDCHPI